MEDKYKAVFNTIGLTNIDFSNEKLTPSDVARDVMTVAKQAVMNDAEFVSGVKKNILENEMTTLSKLVASKYNLKENEYSGKSIEQVIEIGLIKKGNANEESLMLQSQLAERNKYIDNLEKEVIPQLKDTVNKQLSSVRRKQKIGDVIRKFDLVVTDPDDFLEVVYNKLDSNYSLIFDENDNFDIKQKNSSLIPMDEGWKVLSREDIIKKELDKMGLLKKTKEASSNVNQSSYLTNTPPPVPNQNKVPVNQSAIEKARANMQNLTRKK